MTEQQLQEIEANWTALIAEVRMLQHAVAAYDPYTTIVALKSERDVALLELDKARQLHAIALGALDEALVSVTRHAAERDAWKGRAELWDISNLACRAEITRLQLERERLVTQLSDVRDTLEIENNDELWIRDLLGRLDWTSQPAPLDAPEPDATISDSDCTIRGVK